MSLDQWLPADEFFDRFASRLVLDPRHFPSCTVLWHGVRPLYSEFGCETIRSAVRRHVDADVWTEHEGIGHQAFYSFGVGLVNRTGVFLLVRKQHSSRAAGAMERLVRRIMNRPLARRA